MTDEQKIKSLEDMVHRLKIETWSLRQIMHLQVKLNNKNHNETYDDAIEKLAQYYADKGLDSGDNREVYETIMQYSTRKNSSPI